MALRRLFNRLSIILIVSLALPLFVLPARPAAAAAAWQLGQNTQTTTYNCITERDEVLALNWAGYYGEPGVSPHVGEVFYVQALWGVTGNPCPSGQAGVHVEFTLPQGTQLAIDSSHPVHCIKEDFSARTATEDTADCPQAPKAGLQGGLAFDPPEAAMPGGLWRTESGFAWHIQIPVVSSQALDGLETGSCSSCLKVGLYQIDGNYNPWTYPQVGIPVVAGATPSPSAPGASPSFPDVPTTSPYYQAITQLAARGIIHGYADGTFGPDDTTKRAQMAALIARGMGWDAENWGNAFPDQQGVDADLWRNVGTLAHYGVAKGYPDGHGGYYYDPLNTVLGAQVISFITRAMVQKGTWQAQADDPRLYPNVPASSGHRVDLATYTHYVGAIPGTDPHTNWAAWSQASTRGWFAQALWSAIGR